MIFKPFWQPAGHFLLKQGRYNHQWRKVSKRKSKGKSKKDAFGTSALRARRTRVGGDKICFISNHQVLKKITRANETPFSPSYPANLTTIISCTGGTEQIENES